MPDFHELPLFLDRIKSTVSSKGMYMSREKLAVVHSLLKYTCDRIRFDSGGKAYLFNVTKDAFVYIFRLHILKYLYLEGPKRDRLKLYSHAMTMKKLDLEPEQNRSLDVILYLAFFEKSGKYAQKNSVYLYTDQRSYLSMYYKDQPKVNSEQILSIDDMYDNLRFKNEVTTRINDYLLRCIASCNLTYDSQHMRCYVNTKQATLVFQKHDEDDCFVYYKIYSFEDFLYSCIQNYAIIVKRYQTK